MLFTLILIIFVLEFCFSRTLSLLNVRSASKPIPALLQGIYDGSEYERQQRYFQTNTRFGWICSLVNFSLLLAVLLCDGFAWLDSLVRTWTDCEMLVMLLFFGLFFLGSILIELPFSIYDTFVIEKQFGFNKTTPAIFVADFFKGLLLNAIILGISGAAIFLIYQQVPNFFWLLAWAVVSIFSLFMSQFYSKLIVPLFNKQTPLEAGELRDAIENFAKKVDFKLQNIYVIDGSKRSTKANAYFTGWGRRKRIVLYDTLISQLTTDEIVAVLAHEVGHNKHRHVLSSILLSLALNLLLFVLIGLALGSDCLAQALGVETASFHINLLAFSLLYQPINIVLTLVGNVLSRRHEYQADAFVKQNGYGEHLISALKKISSQALSNLTPHPAYVFVNYSHPTLLQRIEALS